MQTFTKIASPKLDGGDDLLLIKTLADGTLLVAHADGASGIGFGRRAAEVFLRTVESFITECFVEAAAIGPVLAQADVAIMQEGIDGDTTGIVMLIKDGIGLIGAVGDSEAWMLTDGGPVELTKGQLRKPRIGDGIEMPYTAEFEVTGTIVIGSDGLFWSYPSRPELFRDIRKALIKGENPAEAVVAAAIKHGQGHLTDDISVIVARP
jgi:hypothetical protein